MPQKIATSYHLSVRATALVLLACAAASLAGCGGDFDRAQYLALNENYTVTIERDVRGVPHVIGLKDTDTAFGFAYAQAEDNWPIMQETLATNRGIRARTEGPDAAVTDFLIAWLGIWDTLETAYDTELEQRTRDYVEAFADGINFYSATHPDETNLDLYPISGKDIVAGYMFRHTMLSLIHI